MGSLKRTLIVILLLLSLPALACGSLGQSGGEEEATEAPTVEEEAPPPEEPPEEPPQQDLCGDGVCDEKEQDNPALCPEDCPQAAPPQINLTGTWDSPEWGLMELSQKGSEIVGTYIYHDGQIEGRLEGNRLTYRWWEFAPGQPYETVTDPSLHGDGYFDVSPDGNHIEGEWRFANSTGWDGFWSADRR